MAQSCLDLEIGTTLANMTNLRDRGVPDVTSWEFQPYSSVQIRGDGRSVGFGFPTASWTWEVLSQDQLNALLELFAAETDSSVVVYIYTYVDSGSGTGDMRARFSAIMHRPIDGQGKSMWPDSRSPVLQDVTVNFTRLESA
jgi:hypothetical protein